MRVENWVWAVSGEKPQNDLLVSRNLSYSWI